MSQAALRTIETGRVPTPAFFTVAALAAALDVPLDLVLAHLASPAGDTALSARGGKQIHRVAVAPGRTPHRGGSAP